MYTSVKIPEIYYKRSLVGAVKNSKSIEQSHQEEFKEMESENKTQDE